MDGGGDEWVGAMMAREQKRTTGHVNLSAYTWDVHMKRNGRSALRDKALWVTGLVSKANAYPILTPPWGFKFQPSWVDLSPRRSTPLARVSSYSRDARSSPSTTCVTGIKDCECV